MRLLLVRHGQTASNASLLLDTAAPGADLTELGLRQAQGLVDRLRDHQIQALYVSDLVRTQQTVEPLAASLGLTPTVLGGLREIPAGEDEMSADWARYISVLRSWGEGDPAARLPGGENAHEFLERYDAALTQIASSGFDCVVVVSHGAAIRAWTSHHVPQFVEEVVHAGLPNTTVIVLEGDPEHGWSLVAIEVPEDAD